MYIDMDVGVCALACNCSISFTISGQQAHTKPMLHFGQFHIRRVAGIESAVEDEEMALVNA